MAICLATGIVVGVERGTTALYAGGIAVGAVVAVLVVLELVASLATIAFLLVAAGLLCMNADGVHVSLAVTASDALLALAAPLLALLYVQRRLPVRIPMWIVAGGALIATSALLLELFPAPPTQAQIFQNVNLQTGQVEALSSLSVAVRVLVALVVVPVVVAAAATSWRRWRVLIDAWLLGSAASCFVAVLAYVGPDLQMRLTGQDYTIPGFGGAAERYAGLAVHPTLLGVTGAMAAPVVLARVVSGRAAAGYAPLLAVYALGVLLSGSRWALLALIVGFVLVFATQPRARRQLTALAVAGALLGAAFGIQSGTFSSIQRLLGSSQAALISADTSNSGRELAIGQGLHFFLKRPLIGSSFTGIRGAHNVALEFLSSGGLIAFAGYALIVGAAITLGTTLRRRLPTGRADDVLGLVTTLWVLLFIGLATNASIDRFLYLPVGLLIGAGSLWYRELSAASVPSPPA